LSAVGNIMAADPAITEGAAQAALARVGLADASLLFPDQLSGGAQRRVALARAFSVNARLLLLDEPFVSLDRTLVTEIQQLFTLLVAETQSTVIFVSHLSDDAARLADRAILLDGYPARVLADMALPVPPAERDDRTLESYRAQLDQASGLPGSKYG
jgi:ABC-type nitrate/sulfonate/bicarbonate transport system ATPase subunit